MMKGPNREAQRERAKGESLQRGCSEPMASEPGVRQVGPHVYAPRQGARLIRAEEVAADAAI
jgi:hypothetical protein